MKKIMDTDTYDIIPENESDSQTDELEGKRAYWGQIPLLGYEVYGYTPPNVDIVDGLILSYIYRFYTLKPKNKKKEDRRKFITVNNKRYLWIRYSRLISANPFLSIKSKSGVSKRINKLKKLGLIESYKAPDNSIYIRPTQILIDIYNYRSDKESPNVEKPHMDINPVSPESTPCGNV